MSQNSLANKRPPEYTIDERTLQDKPKQSNNQQQNGEQKISERKIHKIKEPDNQKNNETQKKSNQQTQKKSNGTNEDKKQNGSSLFNNTSGSSLFGNINSSLFKLNGSTQTKNGSTSLLNSGNGQLFGGSVNINQQTSLFGGSKKPETKSLLFSGNNGSSIFNFDKNGPPPQTHSKIGGSLFASKDEEDGSGSQQQLQKGQAMQTDKSKSTGKYEYKVQNKIVMTKKVRKFRKNNNDVIQNVEIQIQTDKEAKNAWLIGRLDATKNVILNGFILKQKSTVRHLNNKNQNVEVVVFTFKKDGEKQSLQKNIIRLQFFEQTDGSKFLEEIKQLI